MSVSGWEKLRWWLLSVSIFRKTIGIGLATACIFGVFTLFMARQGITHGLYRFLEQRTLGDAELLATRLGRFIAIGDRLSVQRELRRFAGTRPDVRYAIVYDERLGVLAHSFERAVPSDLLLDGGPSPAQPKRAGFRVLETVHGLLFEATTPIVAGHAGWLRLALRDDEVVAEVASVTCALLWALALCAVAGLGLGLAQTHLIVDPIHRLQRAARQVEAGDLSVRAKVHSADEIGRLAVAFNRMAASLQRSGEAVVEKERARLALIDKIVWAQEEERRAISRELHDELGQSLMAALLTVQAASRNGGMGGEACGELEGRLRHLADDVRRLVWGMRPSILDDYGLDSTLTRYVAETSRLGGVEIDYQYSKPEALGRLPERIETTLYRVAQEALNNVVRHAEASQASLVLLHQQHQATLIVEDNGRGFDPMCPPDGLGLVGMRERVALLGGRFELESAPGRGTTLHVAIPLLAQASPGPSLEDA